MEIKIRDEYYHQEISIPLLEQLTNNVEFYKDYIFVENGTYSIELNLETESDISEIYIYLGDLGLNTYYDEIANVVRVHEMRMFEDCFDVVNIKVEICYFDDNVKIFETPNLYVAVKKVTCQYVQSMLKDIEDNYPQIIDAFYSSSRKQVEISNGENRGYKDTISLLSTIYTILRETFPVFQQGISKTINEQYKYSKGINAGNIDPETINWIIMHPECLQESRTPTPINIKQKYYNINQIHYLAKKESPETYENKCVLGFIQTILSYIRDRCTELEEVIYNFELEIPYEEIKKLPPNYDLAYNSVLFYYKELQRTLKSYKESFENLFDAYLSCLKCEVISLNKVPRYTFIFREKFHYRRCFEAMVMWFEMGNCSLQSIGSFLRLKKLSRIFEYYTLLKLKEAVIQNNFKEYGESECHEYEGEVRKDIDNFYPYISKNGETKISIYYEPHIYRDKVLYGIDLYSIGYHFQRIFEDNRIVENKYWTPDFVVKFEEGTNSLYFILDSKFSSFKSVCNYHIAKLANKYALSIASKDEFYSKIAGVWAIYPSEKNERLNLKKNLIKSENISLTIIAIEPLLTNDNSLIEIVRGMKEIFDKMYLAM